MSISGASESIDTDEEGDPVESAETPVPNYDNPEQATALREAVKEKRQAKRDELTQAEKDKQAIYDAIERETCNVRIGPKRVEFSILWGDDESIIEDMVGEFIGVDEDEDELSADQYHRYQELNQSIIEILAAHAIEDTYDETFFRRLPQTKRERAVMDLRSGGIEGERAGN